VSTEAAPLRRVKIFATQHKLISFCSWALATARLALLFCYRQQACQNGRIEINNLKLMIILVLGKAINGAQDQFSVNFTRQTVVWRVFFTRRIYLFQMLTTSTGPSD
jgi:hypothetical protein